MHERILCSDSKLTLCASYSSTLMLYMCPYASPLIGYTRERTERRARLFGGGEENTQIEKTYTNTHDIGPQNTD